MDSCGLTGADSHLCCAESPGLEAALQVVSHQSGANEQNPLPPLLPTVLWMQPRNTIELPAHVARSCAASCPSTPPSLFSAGLLSVHGTNLTKEQHFVLGLVELDEIPKDPLPELIQVPLDGILPFRPVSLITQLYYMSIDI